MVGLDDRAFNELITESQDLYVDAMKQIKTTLPAGGQQPRSPLQQRDRVAADADVAACTMCNG